MFLNFFRLTLMPASCKRMVPVLTVFSRVTDLKHYIIYPLFYSHTELQSKDLCMINKYKFSPKI